jgi:flagellar hook assembly protein FlgD
MDPKKMYKSKGKTSLPASKISRDKLRELAKKEGKTQLEMVDRIITHYHNEHM